MMLLKVTVCLLLFLSHARAQGCAEILISDLGSTDTAGTGGAIAQLFSSGETGNAPDILVTSSRTVCLAAAATRGNYRFASVIVTYDCGGPAAVGCPPGPYPRTDQFEFGCADSVWQQSTSLVDDRNLPVNPSITTLRRDCSFCISPDDANTIGIIPLQNPVDNETHCAACDPSCLTGNDGLGYCTNVLAVGCCNVYQPQMNGVNTCAVSCDTGFEADPPLFLCERRCPMLDAPRNGEVSQPSRTVDSVATYSCNIGFTIVEGDEMRTCNANSIWDREALLCSAVDCGDLTPPPFGQINLPGTTFGSTATYSCNGDRELTGDMTRTCQANGTWSGISPECGLGDLTMDPDSGGLSLHSATSSLIFLAVGVFVHLACQ